MRIAYLAAGAGGMYCGSCIHDNAAAAALQQLGHEVALLPTYTPLRTDEEGVSDPQLFYGAVGVYLRHRSGFFRRLPRPLARLLDRRGLIRWAARVGGATDPAGLGGLTLDVLRGERGAQSAELDRLVEWLAASFRPDVVQITNSLLLGLARRIKERLGVPVIVGLQGEDLFIEQLAEPARGLVVAELRARAADADLFLAPSRYYARHMAGLLGQDPSRMRVVPLGIRLDGHGEPAVEPGRPPTIGYLARVCPEKGLHRLVDAFLGLAAMPGSEARLRVAGYLGARDRDYWQAQHRRLAEAGLGARVDFLGEIGRDEKIRFLRSLDVLCVPSTYREAKGLYALEALANGVPVVLPDHGSLPELVADTGGGVLVPPDSTAELVAALRRLLDDPEERRRLGRQGRQGVHARRGAAAMARATAEVYHELVAPLSRKAERSA
ncbi:MAG: glycosyltransferase family 4 protein [Acidobacteriota bacterium]|nr:glycosyltransferase family 4 protein [Acidobacteriota bacterium]